MAIHQEVSFTVAPERVYELLTDSAQFAAATARPAISEPTAALSQSLAAISKGAKSSWSRDNASSRPGVAVIGPLASIHSCGSP
jgi:hypothetical protein